MSVKKYKIFRRANFIYRSFKMNRKRKRKLFPNQSQLFPWSIVQHFASSVCLFRPNPPTSCFSHTSIPRIINRSIGFCLLDHSTNDPLMPSTLIYILCLFDSSLTNRRKREYLMKFRREGNRMKTFQRESTWESI